MPSSARVELILLTGCPEGGSETTYYLAVVRGGTTWKDYCDGKIVRLSNQNPKTIRVYIYVYNNTLVNNVVFTPCLKSASNLTNKDLTDYTFATYDQTSIDISEDDVFPLFDFTYGVKRKVSWNTIRQTMKTFLSSYFALFTDILDQIKKNIGWYRKNELHIDSTITTQEVNGITFTITRNSAGEVTEIDADGTATASTYFLLAENVPLENGNRYVFSGCSFSLSFMCNLEFRYYDGSETYFITQSGGNPKTFTYYYEGSHSNQLNIKISNGATLSHEKFYPMLCASNVPNNTTFEPYQKTVQEEIDSIQQTSITVYDGLDSQSTTDALSANQGYVLKNYANALRTVMTYRSVTITATSAMSANLTLYYNDFAFQFGNSYTVPAGTFTCSITNGNYVYLGLGSISNANLRLAFPYLSSDAVSISVGYFVFGVFTNMYQCSFYRNSTSASTWYLCNPKYRVASSASSKKITVSANEVHYWLQGARFKNPTLPDPLT